jgi:hypothetical protein
MVHNDTGILFFRKSTTFNRQRLDEQSQQIGKVLSDVQQQAIIHGNKAQLERLKLRLSASQTSNDKPTPEAQEVYSSDAQNMTYSYSTLGPSVIVVPDTQTLELFEKRKCSESTLEFLGETPHSLERDSKDATTESEFHILTSLSAVEGEGKDMSVDIVTLSHKLTDRPITTVQNVGTVPEVLSLAPQFETLTANDHGIKQQIM